MANAAPSPALRVSLRECLALVAAVAVSCAALKYANGYWLSALSIVLFLTVMAAAIIALVDRGSRQATAMGFLTGVLMYAVLVQTQDRVSQAYGTLPTTDLTWRIYAAMSTSWYEEQSTGKRVEELPTGAIIVGRNGMGGGMGGVIGGLPQKAYVQWQLPDPEYFTRIAHAFWALAFGYFAAKFARWVYARRLREQEAR
jgi:hypothetical protein